MAESPSRKSPSGWPGADGQGRAPLVHSLLQWPLFQIRLLAPGSCASSSHLGFVPINRKEESSSLAVLLALRRPERVLRTCAKAPRGAAMRPAKVLSLSEKGEPLGDSRQALPQTGWEPSISPRVTPG